MIVTRRVRLLAVVVAALFGLSGLRLALESLRPQNAMRKDFRVEHLMARAIATGADPYEPLPQLAERFGLTSVSPLYAHRSPHTPSLALVCLPFALLSYPRAAALWTVLQLLSLWFVVFLLLRWFHPRAHLLLSVAVFLAALGWSHVWEDLVWGQMNCFLLLLLVGAWLGWRGGRDGVGGALLGAAICFKLIFWPLALWLVLCRRWRGVLVVALTCAVFNLLAAVAISGRTVIDYYVHTGPEVSALYRGFAQNLSLWSLGWRAFVGTGAMPIRGAVAPPLFHAPQLALAVSVTLILLTLLVALWAALRLGRRVDGFDLAWALMLCACLLVSPLTWSHYLMLLALPLTIALARLRDSGFPRRETLRLLTSALLLLPSNTALENFVFSFSAAPPDDSIFLSDVPVSFAASLLTLLPTLGVLLLAWSLWRRRHLAASARPA